MKAISLWEPWASLMMTGAKTIETRSWQTNYRGDLLICSSKAGLKKDELRWAMESKEFRRGLIPLLKNNIVYYEPHIPFIPIEKLNFGKALCIVKLYCITSTTSATELAIEHKELRFGDYSPGRFAWLTQSLRLIKPFEVKGKQGLFNVDDSLIQYLD